MGNIGDAITKAIVGLFIICCISVPLGLWKLYDIAIWIYNHVEIGIK
jgi:hypothetical protein